MLTRESVRLGRCALRYWRVALGPANDALLHFARTGRLKKERQVTGLYNPDEHAASEPLTMDRVIEQWQLMENAPLRAAMAGATLCPRCKGRGHEGLGLLEADWPCRQCYGAGTL